jgi:hypothetical protein
MAILSSTRRISPSVGPEHMRSARSRFMGIGLLATSSLYPKFARLLRSEEIHGLYSDLSHIGTREGWERVLTRHGFCLRGHAFVRKPYVADWCVLRRFSPLQLTSCGERPRESRGPVRGLARAVYFL